MAIEWTEIRAKFPPDAARVLIFSPDYPEDSGMRYRVVDAHFVPIMQEATHWAFLTPPEGHQ